MNVERKIAAYTIIEVIVTISISGIIVLSSLMIYTSFQKVFNKNLQSIQKNTELALFNNQISRDIIISEKIFCRSDKLVFQQLDSTEISYQFLNDYIIRYGNETEDTHFIKHSNLEYNYCLGNLINEIEFDITTESNKFKYYICKEYNNSTLINITFSNGN